MSATHLAFQTGRRPLSTPVQPGQHFCDIEMSQADEAFSDPQLMIDPSLAPMDPVVRAPPMGWQIYPTAWRQYSKDVVPSYLVPEQAPYYHDPYASWQTSTEQASLIPFGRHESPFSQHPSFSSGESLSPPAESNAYPRTPPDTSVSSPFQQSHEAPDAWDACQSQVLFTGMGHAHESPSVNPHDVNPSQATAEGSVTLSRSPSFGPEICLKLLGQQPLETFEHEQSPDYHGMPEIRDCVPAESVYPDPDNDTDVEPEVSQDDKKDKARLPGCPRRRGSDNKVATTTHSASGRKTHKRAKRKADLHAATTSAPPKATHKASSTAHACGMCDEVFRDDGGLQKHRKLKHLRPFTCIFHFAGCPSSFPSKNEWKRHVMTQHLALHYWLCTQGECVKSIQRFVRTPAPGAISLRARLPDGAIFNRKDLYTQHVRRMHVPEEYTEAAGNSTPKDDWEKKLRELQSEAEQTRCRLPEYMECPSARCTQAFHGSNAWDERMEHVAKHLDKACEGAEPPLAFGGTADPTLTTWAESPEVGVVRKVGEGRWELVNMLRGSVGPSRGNGKGTGGSRAAVAVGRKRRAEREPEEEDEDGDEDEEDADGDED